MLSNKFYTYETKFWCARPETQSNQSISKWLNLTSPLKTSKDKTEFDLCSSFDVDYNKISSRPEENATTKICQSWEYGTEPFEVSNFMIF